MLAHQVLLFVRQFGHSSSNAAGSCKSTKFATILVEENPGTVDENRKSPMFGRVLCLRDVRTFVDSTPDAKQAAKIRVEFDRRESVEEGQRFSQAPLDICAPTIDALRHARHVSLAVARYSIADSPRTRCPTADSRIAFVCYAAA
jgi:hypothetical protein